MIATGYSGNLDFMNPNNSFLVPFDLVPVGPGSNPYPADAVWASPDVVTAASLMRRVVESPAEVAEKTEMALAEIAGLHCPLVRSRFVLGRLHDVRSSRGPSHHDGFSSNE